MLRAPSLPRPDLQDRHTRLLLAAGAVAIVALAGGLVFAIGSGSLGLTLGLAGLAFAPALVLLALKRPYLFPYGLYVALIPFDNMLRLGGGGTLTKMLGIAAGAFVAIAAFRRRELIRPPLALYFWLAYVVLILVSMMWTSDVPEGLTSVEQMVSQVLLYAVLATAPIAEGELRTICRCIVLGGIAAAFYGIYLLHQLPAVGGDFGRLMINVDNRTIDPNHFANSLLAPFALACVALTQSRRPGHIAFALFAIAVLVAGILVSLSREALLACVVIVAVLVWFSRRRLVAVFVGVPLLIAIPAFVPAIGERMADAFATGGAGRMSIWQVGWRAFTQHPLFGWGAGGALEAYDRNYLAVFQAYNAGWTRPPHNALLHAMLDVGLVGAALLVAAYLASYRGLEMIRRGDRLYDIRVALTASLIALGFVAFFIDLATYKYLWLVMAAMAQLRGIALLRRAAAKPSAAATPRQRPALRHGAARA